MLPFMNASPVRRVVLRMVLSGAMTAVALLSYLALWTATGARLPTYVTFYPVVMLVALLFGLWSGLLVVLLSALAVDLFVLGPQTLGTLHSPSEIAGLVLFLANGVFISVVADLLRRARHRAAEADARRSNEAALRHTAERCELLAGIAGELLRTDQPQMLVESLCGRVMAHLDCQVFFNFLLDDRAGRLHLNACAGIDPAEAKRIEWLDVGVAVCGCAARDGKRIVAEHVATTSDERTALVRSYGVRAYACHPLLGPSGRVLGTLSFGTRCRDTFAAEELSLMKAVADQVAVTLVRVSSEQELRHSVEELGRSNRELEQFAYIASHDLQEPLRQVSAFARLLDERHREALNEPGRTYVGFIVQGAERMSRLVADLLAYSRVGARQTPPGPVSAEVALAGAMANLDSAIAEGGARISHSPLPTVEAHATEMVQLFQNLLANAIKFRRDGVPPEIHVSAEPRGGLEEKQWLFSVRDNGIGIPPDQRERVFLLFQRLHGRDEAIMRKYPGTGIGLAICKKIVERCGGRIWVTSGGAPDGQGAGATFQFTLPGTTGALAGSSHEAPVDAPESREVTVS